MPNTNLEDMSLQLKAPLDPRITSELQKLRALEPELFQTYEDKSRQHAPTQLSESVLIKVISAITVPMTKEELLVAEKYNAGINACEAFGAIATIAKMPKLAKALDICQLSLNFSQQFGAVQKIMASGTASFSTLGGPVTMLLTLGAQIFGSFIGGSETGPEEAMAQQLQAISQQIVDLHRDLLEISKELHEHIQEVHHAVIDCAKLLNASFTRQIQGLENVVVGRFDSSDVSIENLRKIITVGQHESLIQPLKELFNRANAILEGNNVGDEQAAVQDIVSKLENEWIKDQCALQTLTGRSMFVAENGKASHDNDVKMLLPDMRHLQNNLGYLALIAQEMGLDFRSQANGISTVELAKIAHVDLLRITIHTYLELRRRFPSYIPDENGQKFTSIISYVKNTLDFIRKVADNEVIFAKLFANYNAAVTELQNAIANKAVTANKELQDTFESDEIDLLIPYETLANRFKHRMPDKSIPSYSHGSAPIAVIDPSNLPYKQRFELPPEVFLAEQLKLGSITSTYNARVLWNGGGGQPFISAANMATFIHELQYPLNMGLVLHFDIKVNFANKVNKANFANHVFTQNCLAKNSLTMAYFNSPVSVENVVNNLNFESITKAENHDVAVASLGARIKDFLVLHRKLGIVEPALKNAVPEINNALQHLDSAQMLLVAFSMVAGLPEDIQNSLRALTGADDIQQDFAAYLANATMDTPYCRNIDMGMIDNVRDACLQAISDNRVQATFASPIAANLSATLEHISLARALHINYYTRPNMRKSAADKARDLGLSLSGLRSSSINKVTQALIKAIIENDANKIETVCKPYNMLGLHKPLTEDLIRPLHLAAYIGYVPVIAVLLAKCREVVDYETLDRYIPLMYAAKSGSLAAVQMIYEAGGGIDSTNDAGKTATMLAQEHGFAEIHAYLLAKQQNDPQVIERQVQRPRCRSFS